MAYYFAKDLDYENCYPLETIKDMMRFEGITKTDITKAEAEKGSGYFYCKVNLEVGEVGESCGKICKDYAPRNGKNGRCRFSANVYAYSNQTRVLKL